MRTTLSPPSAVLQPSTWTGAAHLESVSEHLNLSDLESSLLPCLETRLLGHSDLADNQIHQILSYFLYFLSL